MLRKQINQLGLGSALLITVLSFGAFAGAVAIVTNNQFGVEPVTLADDGEDDGDNESDGNEDENENDGDENKDDNDDIEKEREDAKKEQEKERERAKKSAERARENFGKEDDEEDNDEVGDDDGDVNDDDDVDEIDDDSDDDNDGRGGDYEGMFKDRDKTLEKLRKEIAEARENILEKGVEGADVTGALARLALAEANLNQVGSLFDANDLETAKALAKQIKKIAHFAEKDAHNAEKISEELAKVEKRFGQVNKKIATLESLGGDAEVFKTQLASLRSDFSVLRSSLTTTPGSITRETIKAFEKRVKRLKSLVESSIFAYGGTDDDDDLFRDHKEDSDDLLEDLDDVAEIEDGDDNGVSRKVRRIANEHKAEVETVKKSLEDIQDRGEFTRTLFGPDFNALDGLRAQIAAMNTRAAALESAAGQITDPDIKQILLTQADALRSEALKLQSYITAEDNQFSIFGSLRRFFR